MHRENNNHYHHGFLSRVFWLLPPSTSFRPKHIYIAYIYIYFYRYISYWPSSLHPHSSPQTTRTNLAVVHAVLSQFLFLFILSLSFLVSIFSLSFFSLPPFIFLSPRAHIRSTPFYIWSLWLHMSDAFIILACVLPGLLWRGSRVYLVRTVPSQIL